MYSKYTYFPILLNFIIHPIIHTRTNAFTNAPT